VFWTIALVVQALLGDGDFALRPTPALLARGDGAAGA
jgi:hypothetical protein